MPHCQLIPATFDDVLISVPLKIVSNSLHNLSSWTRSIPELPFKKKFTIWRIPRSIITSEKLCMLGIVHQVSISIGSRSPRSSIPIMHSIMLAYTGKKATTKRKISIACTKPQDSSKEKKQNNK